MAGDARFAVQVIGLKELQAAFLKLYPELKVEFHSAMDEIVKQVAATAREEAARQGFAAPGRSGRGTGLLIGSIRTSVIGTGGYLRDTASRLPNQQQGLGGYPYPRRYEYQHGMERAFLHPAVSKERDKIVLSIAAVTESVIARFNEGGA